MEAVDVACGPVGPLVVEVWVGTWNAIIVRVIELERRSDRLVRGSVEWYDRQRDDGASGIS